MDADGLIPDAVRNAIRATKAAGKTIKFLYTIPNFHNPAGVTLTVERRREIVEICAEENILILEDNPYGLLGFDQEPMPAMRSMSSENIIYLGSFSKTFAPGFRVGWALAPHSVREKLVLAQESATLCPPQFSQMAISAYLANHDWEAQIKDFREMYRERRDAMIGALSDMMPPSVRWNVPDGGFYVWITLPPGINAKAMLPRAVTARVAYVPGTAFFADGFGSSRCGSRSATPPPSGSVKAYDASPASSRRRWSCRAPSASTTPPRSVWAPGRTTPPRTRCNRPPKSVKPISRQNDLSAYCFSGVSERRDR